jgi:hypothetical protein
MATDLIKNLPTPVYTTVFEKTKLDIDKLYSMCCYE